MGTTEKDETSAAGGGSHDPRQHDADFVLVVHGVRQPQHMPALVA